MTKPGYSIDMATRFKTKYVVAIMGDADFVTKYSFHFEHLTQQSAVAITMHEVQYMVVAGGKNSCKI